MCDNEPRYAIYFLIQSDNSVDRGYLSHFLFQDFCIFCVWFLGRLWYAKILSGLLATIEQYGISFKRNTMVVNEQFIRRRDTTLYRIKSDIQTQSNNNISSI